MSTFTEEIKSIVKQYYLDKYGLELDFNEIPWHKIVGYSWEAKTHYKMDGYCRSLDEVDPKEHEAAHVWMKPGVVKTYLSRDGEWVYNGELNEDMYK
jgi:hypothetical protein